MLSPNIARGKGGARGVSGEEDPASWEPWVLGVKGAESKADFS